MSRPTPDRGEVVVYEAPDGSVRLEVRVDRDSVWLSQRHIAELLDTSTDNVGLHLKNIYTEGELEEPATTEDSSVVQVEGRRKVRRKVRLYNLDAILSVGYRVSSKRGTQFRIWATRTLREHLLRGYTLNERRLREKGLGDMEQAVGLLAKTLTQHALVTGEGRAVLDVVQGYARAWRWLLEYDEERLAETPTRPKVPIARLTLDSARAAIASLRKDLATRGEATALLGRSAASSSGRSSPRSSRPSARSRSIPRRRSARPTSCTSSSRTIRSRTATSASGRSCFWSTCA